MKHFILVSIAISTLVVVFIFLTRSSETRAPDVCSITDNKGFEYYTQQEVKIDVPKQIIKGDNVISIELSNPKFPSGYMVSAFLDIIEEPKESNLEIVDGYPKTIVSLSTPGDYEFSMRVNLIYKAS
jgi:hypothetical protein